MDIYEMNTTEFATNNTYFNVFVSTEPVRIRNGKVFIWVACLGGNCKREKIYCLLVHTQSQ